MTAVLVHIDLDGDQPCASSVMALAAGRNVASGWGATLYAAFLIHDPTGHASGEVSHANAPVVAGVHKSLARGGADKCVVALTDVPVTPLWATIGRAWRTVIDHVRPRLVLFGADAPSAAELAPRTGARMSARLLVRARATSADEIELWSREGGSMRVSDSGAAVAMIGVAGPAAPGIDEPDLVVVAAPGNGDSRIELVDTTPADLTHTLGPIVVIGDEAARDPQVVVNAQRLAAHLGAHVASNTAIASATIVDRTTPIAPELCVSIGNARVDVAGSTSLVKIGATTEKLLDGALSGSVSSGLSELLRRLEDP